MNLPESFDKYSWGMTCDWLRERFGPLFEYGVAEYKTGVGYVITICMRGIYIEDNPFPGERNIIDGSFRLRHRLIDFVCEQAIIHSHYEPIEVVGEEQGEKNLDNGPEVCYHSWRWD